MYEDYYNRNYQNYYQQGYPQQSNHNYNYNATQYPARNNTPPTTNIEYVNGIEGVKALVMPPNCSKLVLDSDSKCFYIKRTDFEGRPTIEVHPYTDVNTPQRPVEPQLEFVTVTQFNELKQELESLKSSLKETKE